MKLVQISARNFQGESFTLDLAAINFLVGGNFKGKTTRLNAIRLFLLGYLPEQGKTNEATFRLSSGREMEVAGKFDNGEVGHRRWKAKGNSISKDEQMPASFTAAVKDLVAFMMDSDTYFALTETKRVEYVARNAKVSGAWSPDSIVDRVVKVLGDDANDASEKIAGKLSTIAGQVEGEKWSPQEFVEAAIAGMADAASAAKSHAATMEKTAQGLAYLRANDAPAIDAGAYDRQIADLEAEATRLVAEREKNSAAANEARKNASRRKELSGAISSKVRFVERQLNLGMKIDAAKAKLVDHPAPSEAEIEKLRLAETDARAGLRDNEKDLKGVDEMLAVNRKAMEDLRTKEHCPYCGAAGHNWKDKRGEEIESAINGLETKREQLVAHVAVLKAEVDVRAAAAAEARELRAAVSVVESELANLQRELSEVDGDLKGIAAKEEELARIPAEDPAVLKAVDDAQTALNVANDKLSALKRERDSALGRKSEVQRLAKAETDRDEAKAEQAAAEKAVEELRAIQSEMVADAFKPLLNEANALFGGDALPFRLEYNSDKAEIGRTRDGVWVSHKTFSGVEKLLTYAAIQMALAARSPFRIMLLDEMLRAQNTKDVPVFDRLVDACKQAVRERGIDQFVGVIPGEPEDYVSLVANESDCELVPIA